jgi:hypothetical protein
MYKLRLKGGFLLALHGGDNEDLERPVLDAGRLVRKVYLAADSLRKTWCTINIWFKSHSELWFGHKAALYIFSLASGNYNDLSNILSSSDLKFSTSCSNSL